jgi:ATP-dependent DNA ligase
MEYHVFDYVDDSDFSWRTEALGDLFEDVDSGPLVLVETLLVTNEEDLMDCFETFVSEGHEGAMVRNAKGGYYSHPTHRDSNLQKLKEFDDHEWKIVAVKEGKGKLAGHAIFTCKTDAGVEFDVKLKGEISTLKMYFENPETAIGKLLTVQYQGMTSAAGVPRFPVGLHLRED